MKIGIIYTSMSGNTKEVAELMTDYIESKGLKTSSFNILQHKSKININDFDLILIGAYTWGEGLLPKEMRKFLKSIVHNEFTNPPKFAVFGTGEKQWTHYCRAVDEIKYHLSKVFSVSVHTLKIEQSPRGNQSHLPIEFVEKVIGEEI